MNWSSASDFFAMGGHGFYVWGSFLAVALCMIAEPLVLRARRRHALGRISAERKRHEAAA